MLCSVYGAATDQAPLCHYTDFVNKSFSTLVYTCYLVCYGAAVKFNEGGRWTPMMHQVLFELHPVNNWKNNSTNKWSSSLQKPF